VKEKRNYALDLLRIICMLMIVRLHAGSHGELLSVAKRMDVYTLWGWWIQIICAVAVNVFVLISGYYLSVQKFRMSRILRLIIETVFYSWTIYIVLLVSGIVPLSIREVIYSLFPITFRRYWFVTAYIGLSLLAPIINRAIESFSRIYHEIVMLLLCGMTVLCSDIFPSADPFGASGGYSLTWFIVLYLIAAYIRKYVPKKRSKHAFLVYFGMCTVVLFTVLVLWGLSRRISFLASTEIYGYYSRYNSLFVLIASIAVFIGFLNIEIKNPVVIKCIKWMAPLTMGVYLIHDNPDMRYVVWKVLFPLGTMERNYFLPIKTFCVVCTIFIVCVLIDFIRLKGFQALERIGLVRRIFSKADEIPEKVYEIIGGKK